LNPAIQQLIIEFFVLIGSAMASGGFAVLLVLFVEKQSQKGSKNGRGRVSK